MYIYSDTQAIPFECGPPQNPIVPVRSHVAYLVFGQHGEEDRDARKLAVDPYGPPPAKDLAWRCSDHILFLENVQRPPPVKRRALEFAPKVSGLCRFTPIRISDGRILDGVEVRDSVQEKNQFERFCWFRCKYDFGFRF